VQVSFLVWSSCLKLCQIHNVWVWLRYLKKQKSFSY